jgi:putative ABC transport system permease protein
MLDIALKNVSRQRVRSLLTMLGIAMGIGLILTLGSIGEGLNRQISSSFGNMAGIITVSSESRDGISDDLISNIENIEGVTSVVPVGSYRITRGGGNPGGMMGRMTFGGGGGFGGMTFTGVAPDNQDYLIGETIGVDEGRKLDDSDNGAYVVLLGSTTAANQLLNLGDEIEYQRRVNGSSTLTESYYFEVIGILEETGDSSIDSAAYVPLQTMQELEDDTTISTLRVKIDDVNFVESITSTISGLDDSIRASSPLTMVRQLESTLGTIQLAVYGIGAISIIVGCIGVMNTMIMSVMERKREIGIMKAIGATTTNILVQVLQESAVLSIMGGMVGLALGYFANSMVSQFSTFKPILTPELTAIGLGFSLIIGMGAGLYPAWSASRLDPVQVLKYE